MLLEAAAAARVRHVVIASSRGVYGEGRYRSAACEIVFGGLGRRVPELEAGVWDHVSALRHMRLSHSPWASISRQHQHQSMA